MTVENMTLKPPPKLPPTIYVKKTFCTQLYLCNEEKKNNIHQFKIFNLNLKKKSGDVNR